MFWCGVNVVLYVCVVCCEMWTSDVQVLRRFECLCSAYVSFCLGGGGGGGVLVRCECNVICECWVF